MNEWIYEKSSYIIVIDNFSSQIFFGDQALGECIECMHCLESNENIIMNVFIFNNVKLFLNNEIIDMLLDLICNNLGE